MALARTWYQTVLSLPLFFFLGSSVLGHQPQLLWGNSKFSTTARDTQQISLEWWYTVRLTIPKWPDLRLVKHSQFIQSFTVRHFGKTTPSSRSVEATKKTLADEVVDALGTLATLGRKDSLIYCENLTFTEKLGLTPSTPPRKSRDVQGVSLVFFFPGTHGIWKHHETSISRV